MFNSKYFIIFSEDEGGEYKAEHYNNKKKLMARFKFFKDKNYAFVAIAKVTKENIMAVKDYFKRELT